MELDKIYKRLENLPKSISRAYLKDITKVIDDIFYEYDIFYKDSKKSVDKDIFTRKFLKNDIEEDLKICKGFSQNGNKCCRRSYGNSDYCKTHQYLQFQTNYQEKQNENLFIIESSKHIYDRSNFKKHQIDGTFYYIDESFIYDINSLERVGYIQNDKYILTDDPFILCL